MKEKELRESLGKEDGRREGKQEEDDIDRLDDLSEDDSSDDPDNPKKKVMAQNLRTRGDIPKYMRDEAWLPDSK